jgi:hypothetical protein
LFLLMIYDKYISLTETVWTTPLTRQIYIINRNNMNHSSGVVHTVSVDDIYLSCQRSGSYCFCWWYIFVLSEEWFILFLLMIYICLVWQDKYISSTETIWTTPLARQIYIINRNSMNHSSDKTNIYHSYCFC